MSTVTAPVARVSREGRWWSRRAALGHRLFVVLLALCAGGLVVMLGSATETTRAAPLVVLAVLVPVTTVGAALWYRPTYAWAWLLVAGAELLWGLIIAIDPASTQYVAGLPLTINEILSTLAYTAAWGALTALARHHEAPRRTIAGIDSAIILVAVFGVLWAVNRWALLTGRNHLSPYAGFMYPVADGLVAMALVRLAARTSILRPAFLLALGGVVLMLVGDLVSILEPPDHGRRTSMVIWYTVLAMLGLSAIHPTMASITEAQIGWLGEIGRTRLVVLGSSLLAPPAVLVLVGPDVDLLTALGMALTCAVSLTLVLVRLTGIVGIVEMQSSRLSGIARSDPLTNLPNRRTVDAEVERALTEAATHDEPLVVGLLDLDHFKSYNDQRGHGAGDRLLTVVSAAWRHDLPPEVFLGRYGGEEFLVVVRGRELDEVSLLVDGLRVSMPAGCTFSAGLACWDGVEPPVVLVARADRALYAAKDNGRATTWEVRAPGVAPSASALSPVRAVARAAGRATP